MSAMIKYSWCGSSEVFATEMLTRSSLVLSLSPAQPVLATLSAQSTQVAALSATLTPGSALVSPVSEAPTVTAAWRDTGGLMNTAAVRVTARGTVTPTLVTAFLGKSQDSTICINGNKSGDLCWGVWEHTGLLTGSDWFYLCGTAQMWRSSIQPVATWDTAANIVRRHSLG